MHDVSSLWLMEATCKSACICLVLTSEQKERKDVYIVPWFPHDVTMPTSCFLKCSSDVDGC